ncbi:translation initiation factor IF-2-like [Glycine max]|uniref:translation initiation factor IF-2-like n=1 Tax=Glycine max TaxID=3847 RepID=UPI0003DE93AC|nr:translation initiation factor IF-2-like [Glycine max]|eukprot:XP_006598463.1 uncharacterized protein LOC102667600 [Glycine max]
MAQPNSSRLGIPALITALCIARGVVSDSLTFESLSPTINLAYIQKNCWNPNDLTITFLRTRKTRARGPGTSAPFSSAPPTPSAPAPAPVPAPSIPSTQNTEILVPILKSLHHGLCLLDTEPEATPEAEATPEETPEITPAATPSEALEEGNGAADTYYVADMAAAQSTWDPWPTPTLETSLPVQDAPSSPQDDPIPAQMTEDRT